MYLFLFGNCIIFGATTNLENSLKINYLTAHASWQAMHLVLFVYLPLAMPFCLMHTDYLVELAQKSNFGVAPCIILEISNIRNISSLDQLLEYIVSKEVDS